MEFESWLMFSLLFGSFGMGYFIYGKKQSKAVPLISGIVLCAYPYFVTNPFWFFAVGIILVVLPFVVKV